MTLTRFFQRTLTGLVATLLLACGTTPLPAPDSASAVPGVPQPPTAPWVLPDSVASVPARVRGISRWQPVAWSALPGFESDALFEAWTAWLKSCERPGPVFA
ncbi:MAG: transglycosylase, partial [Rhodoferax sp.]